MGYINKKSSKGSVLLVIALVVRWEQDVLPWSECGSKLDFSIPRSALGSIILIRHEGHMANAAIDSSLPQPIHNAKRRSLGCLSSPKRRSVASPNPALQFPLLGVHACSPCLGHLVRGLQCQCSEGYLHCQAGPISSDIVCQIHRPTFWHSAQYLELLSSQ